MVAIRNSAVAFGVMGAPAATVVYTVPSGFVFLLKNILMSAPGLPAMTVNAQVGKNSLGIFVLVFYTEVPPLGVLNYSGWTAVNETHDILLSSTVANTAYYVSGALLPFNPAL